MPKKRTADAAGEQEEQQQPKKTMRGRRDDAIGSSSASVSTVATRRSKRLRGGQNDDAVVATIINIDRIPFDIQIQVFMFLDGKSLCRLSAVNWKFYYMLNYGEAVPSSTETTSTIRGAISMLWKSVRESLAAEIKEFYADDSGWGEDRYAHDHDHDHDDENEKKITATNAPAVAAEASSDDPKALRAEFVALFCGNCCRECGVVANRRSFLPGIIVCEPCRRARKDDKYKLINRSDAKAKYKFLTPEDFKESPSTRVISSFCSVDVFSERDLAMRNNRNMMLMMQQKNNSAAAAKTKPKTNKGHRRGSKK